MKDIRTDLAERKIVMTEKGERVLIQVDNVVVDILKGYARGWPQLNVYPYNSKKEYHWLITADNNLVDSV